MTDRRLLDDGTSVLLGPVTATDTTFHVSGTGWTTNPADYPLQLEIGGERVIATGVTTTKTPAERTVYYTNFPTTGAGATVFGDEWELYNADPGNGGFGVRSDSQIAVVAHAEAVDGPNVLELTAENVAGDHYHAGMKLLLPLLEGEYEFRVRTDGDASEVTSGLAILWPSSNEWPRDGEVDLIESFNDRDVRKPLQFFIHRLNPAAGDPPYDGGDDQSQGLDHEDPYTGLPLDGTLWHKYVFVRRAGSITVRINDGATRVLIDDPAWLPTTPMTLTLQLDAWSDTPPATPVRMLWDWVVVREPSTLVAGVDLDDQPEAPWQTLTVVRSVNRTRKAHPAGAPVRIARSWRLALGHATRAGASGASAPAPPAEPPPPPATVPIPAFNYGGAINVSPGTNVATVVAGAAGGDHIRLLPGLHNINNVRLKPGMHVRFDPGAGTIAGAGTVYAFRPIDENAHGIAIGGDPAAATRPRIYGYGNGTTNQDYAAIMGTPDDRVGGTYTYHNVTDWTVYHLDLEANSASGINIGPHWGVTDCWIHGHLVTGIMGDRIVGSIVADNALWWNAQNPATGIAENGAQIKYTWVNGGRGRTDITPVDRAKARAQIVRNVLEGPNRGPGSFITNYGIWLDLDCQNVLVDYNQLTGHPGFGIFAEGCNNIEVAYNTIAGSNGYGTGLNSNFANAALCFGETTGSWAHHNTIIDALNNAMMDRLSNRADWRLLGDRIADPTSSRYWLSASEAIPAVDGDSNIWTGNNRYTDNILVRCNRGFVMNQGTNGDGQTTHGKTPLATIETARNDYTDSPGILFDHLGTVLSLAGWQALGRQ